MQIIKKILLTILSIIAPILIFDGEVHIFDAMQLQNEQIFLKLFLLLVFVIIPIAVGFKILDYAFKFKEHGFIAAVVYTLIMFFLLFNPLSLMIWACATGNCVWEF